MRISIDPTDKGFTMDFNKYEIYLDNWRIDDCITADDTTGKIIRRYVNPFSDEIIFKCFTGEVSIVKPDDTICIPKSLHESLMADFTLLKYLRSVGVVNWEGYAEAVDMMNSE